MKTNQPTSQDPKHPAPNKENRKVQPGKPGSDPDQTPNREVGKPPVANPGTTTGKQNIRPTKTGL